MTALERLYAAGQEAWPQLTVDAERFARQVAPHLDGDAPAHAADLYLACACAAGEARALAIFEREHLSHVASYLARIDRSPAFVDEVKQMLRERLFVGDHRRIADYSGRGALSGWVRVAAIRTALSLRRGPRHRSDDDAAASELLVTPDPEIHYIKARYRAAFEEAFHAALAALAAQERTVLKLHFLDGLNIERIGALYDVHRATVARWIAGARQTLLDDTRRRLRARLRITDAELESLMGLIRSQLDVSLHGALKSQS